MEGSGGYNVMLAGVNTLTCLEVFGKHVADVHAPGLLVAPGIQIPTILSPFKKIRLKRRLAVLSQQTQLTKVELLRLSSRSNSSADIQRTN